jgi:FKBP-type peptidyl-prolyl cis-trans isomerase (trigger factor)
MTEKRFQKEIIDELSRRAMQRFARRVFQEAGIEALGPVEADEIECVKGQSLRAQLRFHPMPDFELPDLGSLATDEGSTDPRDQISLRLLDLVRFDIPDELVRDELLVDGIDGVEPGDAGWNTARDRVRLMIILRQIARQEGIEVGEKDVDDRIAEKAGEFGTTKDSLQTELEQGGGMQRLRDMLLAESTLEYVMERNTE